MIRFMLSTFILSEDRRGVIFSNPVSDKCFRIIKKQFKYNFMVPEARKMNARKGFQIVAELNFKKSSRRILFFIYFLSNRLFFHHSFFVNFAYKSTVDKGSNYCRAKGK